MFDEDMGRDLDPLAGKVEHDRIAAAAAIAAATAVGAAAAAVCGGADRQRRRHMWSRHHRRRRPYVEPPTIAKDAIEDPANRAGDFAENAFDAIQDAAGQVLRRRRRYWRPPVLLA